MSNAKPDKPDVITYGDHEVITPDTRKFHKSVRAALPNEDDPVARAESALAKLSSEFASWMHDECERLDAARHKVRSDGQLNNENQQALFFAAHDIRGGAATLGYAMAASAANSLCRLIEHTPDVSAIPLSIIDQHVDAVRAIVREAGREDIAQIASTLTSRLRQVTDEFLVAVNRDRPEYLKTIASPSLAPGEF